MSKNKTLYVPLEDAQLYDDARLLCGGSLSRLITSLLREWLFQNDATGAKRAILRATRVVVKSE